MTDQRCLTSTIARRSALTAVYLYVALCCDIYMYVVILNAALNKTFLSFFYFRSELYELLHSDISM
jgi:hypothetical protein